MNRETTLRKIYDALNARDATGAAEALTEDCVFHILPNPLVEARTLRGRADVEAFMRDVVAAHDIQQQVEAVAVSGDFATVFVDSTSTDQSGTQQHIRWADLFRFEGEKIAEHVSLSG